uniref:Cystatin domain-containing protein n=1 Tax=Biomphalaria glabrata TaxID=6526 RepID=A0A2C9L196_BIOGL
MKIILFLVAATLAATCAQRNSAASVSKNHPAVQFALATINNFYAAKGDDAPRVFIGLVAFRSKNFFDRQIDLTVKVDNGIQIERCSLVLVRSGFWPDNFYVQSGPICTE